MSVNARALLIAYLRYQRDIGVDTLVFERGSAARALTVNNYGVERPRAVPLTPPISTTSTPKAARPATGGNAVGGGASDPLSKLSKLRPLDTLDLRKFERLAPPPPVNSVKREKLAVLYRETLNCEKCSLSEGRAKVIFGSGSADGRVFVVGGAPDSCDEASGLPFQGEVGELFDKILGKIGLDRKKDIFATYAQKCKQSGTQGDSPQAVGNHSLNQHEALFAADNGGGFEPQYAAACRTLLDRQIEIIQPKVILVFGHRPANFILENDYDIEQLRGTNHIYKGIPLVATYGLPLMLKETQYRSGAWEDIKKAMGYAG